MKAKLFESKTGKKLNTTNKKRITMTNIEKLKEKGCYDAFCHNLEELRGETIEVYDREHSSMALAQYVTAAFPWGNTPAGYDFWVNIVYGDELGVLGSDDSYKKDF